MTRRLFAPKSRGAANPNPGEIVQMVGNIGGLMVSGMVSALMLCTVLAPMPQAPRDGVTDG